MKKIIRYIISLFYKKYDYHNNYALKKVCQMFFFQKILRINSDVQYPIHWTSEIIAPEKFEPGNFYTGFSKNMYIDARNGVILGQNVYTGPGVTIISMNHDKNDLTKYLKEKPIKIGDNSWLGANSIILPGVELGANTIVGAGAVVTKSFPDGNVTIVGNPAKAI